MVACRLQQQPPFYHDRPSRCYLDVLNYARIDTIEKDKIDMPWVSDDIKFFLYQYQHPPQRILYDLPFVYYVKLVDVFNELHH